MAAGIGAAAALLPPSSSWQRPGRGGCLPLLHLLKRGDREREGSLLLLFPLQLKGHAPRLSSSSKLPSLGSKAAGVLSGAMDGTVAGRLSISRADLRKEGCFDEPVKARAALFHVAAPVPLELDTLTPHDHLETTSKKRDGKGQALKVAKAVNSGPTVQKKVKRSRTPVTFHRAKSLKKDGKQNKVDHYQIIKYPLTTESAVKEIEDNNTHVFIVDAKADKNNIREAVKMMYGIQAKKVNTLIRPDGKKKAYVKLTARFDMLHFANNIATS